MIEILKNDARNMGSNSIYSLMNNETNYSSKRIKKINFENSFNLKKEIGSIELENVCSLSLSDTLECYEYIEQHLHHFDDKLDDYIYGDRYNKNGNTLMIPPKKMQEEFKTAFLDSLNQDFTGKRITFILELKDVFKNIKPQVLHNVLKKYGKVDINNKQVDIYFEQCIKQENGLLINHPFSSFFANFFVSSIDGVIEQSTGITYYARYNNKFIISYNYIEGLNNFEDYCERITKTLALFNLEFKQDTKEVFIYQKEDLVDLSIIGDKITFGDNDLYAAKIKSAYNNLLLTIKYQEEDELDQVLALEYNQIRTKLNSWNIFELSNNWLEILVLEQYFYNNTKFIDNLVMQTNVDNKNEIVEIYEMHKNILRDQNEQGIADYIFNREISTKHDEQIKNLNDFLYYKQYRFNENFLGKLNDRKKVVKISGFKTIDEILMVVNKLEKSEDIVIVDYNLPFTYIELLTKWCQKNNKIILGTTTFNEMEIYFAVIKNKHVLFSQKSMLKEINKDGNALSLYTHKYINITDYGRLRINQII